MFGFKKSTLSKEAKTAKAQIERQFKSDLLPDDSFHGQLPKGCPLLLAVEPKTQERISKLVTTCVEAGFLVLPVGLTDRIPVIHPPAAARPVVIVSTRGLKRTIKYSVDEKKITVESGMTLAELATIVAANDLHLPIDVADPERMTVGEAVARNAFGPRRLKYGTMKNYVTGCNLVLADGSLMECLPHCSQIYGRDMSELVVGSRGAVGIITQVTLRLAPLPEEFHMAMVFVPSAADGEYAINQLLKADNKPATICMTNAQGSNHFNLALEGEHMLLMVGYEEKQSVFEELIEPFRQMYGDELEVLSEDDSLEEYRDIVFWYHEGCEFEVTSHQKTCGQVLEYCAARDIPAIAHPDLGLVRAFACERIESEFIMQVQHLIGETGSLRFMYRPDASTFREDVLLEPVPNRVAVTKKQLDPDGVFAVPGTLMPASAMQHAA